MKLSVLLCGALAWSIANDLRGVLAEQPVPWRVADALHAQGIEPGDSVAILGRKYGRNYDHEFWARLAHIKIVSSIPDDAAVFRLPVPRQRELCAELALTGAKAIVYKPVSSRPMSDRWQLLSDGYYAYPLSHATDGEGVLAPERLVTPGASAAFRDGGQGRVSPGMRARGTSRRERTASSRRRSPDTD